MNWFFDSSLKRKIVLLTGLFVTAFFILVIALTSASYKAKLEQDALRDVREKNEGYVRSIHAIFKEKTITLLALRDDLERYDTRGQMWIHLAAHTGEKVFADKAHAQVYEAAFLKKLEAFQRSDELSPQRMTPQLTAMLADIRSSKNAFGDGMKFFYIGIASPHVDPAQRGYAEYQDSSLWVPTAGVDPPYTPLDRPWYLAGQQAGRERVVFTEPYGERRTHEAVTSGATAIDIAGVRGTLAAAISIKPIMDSLLNAFGDGAQLTIFSQGVAQSTAYVATPPKYIYSSRNAALGEQFKAYNDAVLIQDPAHRDVMALYEHTRSSPAGVLEWAIDGDVRLVAYNTVPEVGWKVYSSVAKKAMLRDALRLQQQVIIASALGLLLLLLANFYTVHRALQPLAHMGRELDALAHTGDLSIRASAASQDEVGKMARAVNGMLDNTARPVKELAQQAQTIARGEMASGATVQVAAKGDIAELVQAFNLMASRLGELEATHRDASPLTGLPGGLSIERAVAQRIASQTPFAFCLFDLDHFKPFNDRYGYSRGNAVIQHTASLIQNAINASGERGAFVGHIGGDDFVAIVSPQSAGAIGQAIIAAFDQSIAGFYDAEDREAGYISSKTRQGHAQRFPIMTLSGCAVDSSRHPVTDYISVGELAAQLKAYAKGMAGSQFVVDRRGG